LYEIPQQQQKLFKAGSAMLLSKKGAATAIAPGAGCLKFKKYPDHPILAL
jgi:hypothetical protein